IDDDTAHHDNQALPSGLGSKFPRLGFALKLLGIHRLVDHTSDFHVTTERQPADTIFTAFVGKLEQLDTPCIKKQIKLFNFNTECTGRQKMSEFVQHNQYRQA